MPPHVNYHWRGKLVVLRALERKLKDEGIPGASIGNLSKVFAGKQPTNADLIQAIAKAEGISMEEVMDLLEQTAEQYEAHKKLPIFGGGGEVGE